MKKKSIKLLTLTLALSGILTACGSSKNESYTNSAAYDTAAAGDYGYVTSNTGAASAEMSYAYENPMAMEEFGYDDVEYESDASTGEVLEESNVNSNRKLIRTVDLSVETENYDTLLGNLSKQINELGGYIEYQYEYNGRIYSDYNENRSASWNIRIPTQRMDEFIVLVSDESNIINKTERVEDVTLQYVDLESHKTALLTEQKRLLELLEQAESVEDLITIEQRLSEVRYGLESMESQLRLLDNKIDYSTINLSIQEVKREVRIQENSVWDRIRNGFVETVYDLGDNIVDIFVEFVVNIPYILIWIIVVIVLIVIFRIIRKRIKSKKLRKQKQVDEKETKEETEEETEKEPEQNEGE